MSIFLLQTAATAARAAEIASQETVPASTTPLWPLGILLGLLLLLGRRGEQQR